jgi:translation initiation factor IF-1
MVKNTIGGKNYKKGKKGGRQTKNPSAEFNTEDGLHFFGQVKSRIGGNTLDVTLQTGDTVHATIPGRFMRRVWFNKDDLIVVRQEGNFYDVVQKVTNAATLAEASSTLNIKLDKDNSNIFRADIDEGEDEDEDEEDEVEKSKASLNAQRRLKDKERDLKRREGEIDTFDREISVVKKGDSSSDSESEDDNDDESKKANAKSKKSQSVKSQSVKSSSTKSTMSTKSTSSTMSTESDSESEEDILVKKVTVQPLKKKTVKTAPSEPVTPQKQIIGTPTDAPMAPMAPKKKIYRETPEEIAKMMGF